jgi:hypothetical protein
MKTSLQKKWRLPKLLIEALQRQGNTTTGVRNGSTAVKLVSVASSHSRCWSPVGCWLLAVGCWLLTSSFANDPPDLQADLHFSTDCWCCAPANSAKVCVYVCVSASFA